MADSKINIKDHDDWAFDNVILMAPSIKENALDESLKIENLVSFFEAKGHNMMVFGDIDARRHIRGLALHFGIDYEPFHYELEDVEKMYSHGGHPIVMSNNLFKPLTTLNQPVFSADSSVYYSGIG